MQTKWVEVGCDNKACTKNEDGTAKVVVVKADSFSKADVVVQAEEGWIVEGGNKKKSKQFCCQECRDAATN